MVLLTDGETFPPENPLEKAEWTFVRFITNLNSQFGFFRFQRWAADYPKSDRQLSWACAASHDCIARSTEHVIDSKSDELYDWPWLYVEDAGAWHMTEEQGRTPMRISASGWFLDG